MIVDVAVIGGGPAGYNAAEKAASAGAKTLLFEKKLIGGVCLNEGCIPTKALLYSAKIYDSIKTAAKYGVDVPEGSATFDLPRMINRKDKLVKRLTGGVALKLKSSGVTTVQGYATITGEDEEGFIIACNDETYQAKYVLLCTGSDTLVPPIKGLADVNFWTSREALESTTLPESLVIIGGGVIGMEFASFFNSLGVKVSVVELLPEILPSVDKEMASMLRADYTKKGVAFHLGTKVTEVRQNQVVVVKNDKETVLDTAQILLSVGRVPILDGTGADLFKLERQGRGLKVNEFMQTSHPRLYAVGDVTGYSMLAHTAIREGEVAVNHLVGLEDRMNYNSVPAVVYTNPEVAAVGLTEEEAKAAGISYQVLKLPMAYSGRFMAENEMVNGLCKLLVADDDRILGCHMLGNPASELIAIAGIAIASDLTVEELKKQIFPHPTVGEIIHETIFS